MKNEVVDVLWVTILAQIDQAAPFDRYIHGQTFIQQIWGERMCIATNYRPSLEAHCQVRRRMDHVRLPPE